MDYKRYPHNHAFVRFYNRLELLKDSMQKINSYFSSLDQDLLSVDEVLIVLMDALDEFKSYYSSQFINLFKRSIIKQVTGIKNYEAFWISSFNQLQEKIIYFIELGEQAASIKDPINFKEIQPTIIGISHLVDNLLSQAKLQLLEGKRRGQVYI